MGAAVLMQVGSASSLRLLADVQALRALDPAEPAREPALVRLEAAIGRDFADRLVASLANDPGGWERQ